MSGLRAEQGEEAARWLRYAQEDLLTAQVVDQNPSLARREVCWLAQQAADKALKAALVFSGVDFPRTHDLDLLCERLPEGSTFKGCALSKGVALAAESAVPRRGGGGLRSLPLLPPPAGRLSPARGLYWRRAS